MMLPVCVFLASLLLFYVLGSFWESLFHEHVLDIIPRSRAARWRGNRLLPDLWFSSFSHNVLHHYRSFRSDYTVQFRSAQEEAALRAVLLRQVGESDTADIVKAGYGLSFTWRSARYFALPLPAGLLWLFALPDVPVALAGLAGSLAVLPYFPLSKYVHPWLHRPWAAMTEAPWPVRAVLRSRYGMAIRVSHFVHHRHPTHNYNLMLLADRLRGRWRAASAAEWDDMIRIGLVEPGHQAMLQGRQCMGHPL